MGQKNSIIINPDIPAGDKPSVKIAKDVPEWKYSDPDWQSKSDLMTDWSKWYEKALTPDNMKDFIPETLLDTNTDAGVRQLDNIMICAAPWLNDNVEYSEKCRTIQEGCITLEIEGATSAEIENNLELLSAWQWLRNSLLEEVDLLRRAGPFRYPYLQRLTKFLIGNLVKQKRDRLVVLAIADMVLDTPDMTSDMRRRMALVTVQAIQLIGKKLVAGCEYMLLAQLNLPGTILNGHYIGYALLPKHNSENGAVGYVACLVLMAPSPKQPESLAKGCQIM